MEAGMDGVESLCAVLTEEARVCSVLSGVLREEQDAVVALRPQAILSCLEQRQTLHDALTRLAEQRRALVRQIADRSGTPAATVTALLPVLPPAPRARMQAGVAALRRALLEARSLERQTERLVGGGLDVVSDLLRALRGLVPGARYGADAQLAAPGPGSESIDRHA